MKYLPTMYPETADRSSKNAVFTIVCVCLHVCVCVCVCVCEGAVVEWTQLTTLKEKTK